MKVCRSQSALIFLSPNHRIYFSICKYFFGVFFSIAKTIIFKVILNIRELTSFVVL